MLRLYLQSITHMLILIANCDTQRLTPQQLVLRTTRNPAFQSEQQRCVYTLFGFGVRELCRLTA